MSKRHKTKKMSKDDLVYEIISKLFLVIVMIVILYPIYFVLVASFSDPLYVNSGKMLFWPRGFTLLGYQRVFKDSRIWIGYRNTILYTALGTILGVAATMLAAYSLSRKDLPGRKIVMFLFIFTMYFSGGMIPFYLVVKGLGLVNSRVLMILSGAVSV